MRRIRKRILGAAAVAALALGSLFSVQSEAAQGLCFDCVYIWFNGHYCAPEGNEGPECVNNRGRCYIRPGSCSSLTVIEK